MAVYIWSDFHLWHENIIKYENRPFKDVIEMNKTILENWRNTISSQDIVFNLGDVGFGNKENLSVIKNMPGHKILILGNHDKSRSAKWWLDVGFDEVYRYPIIYEEFYILSHEPLYINDHMPYVNLHGHTHSEPPGNKYKLNMCVEHTDYKPVPFENIKKHFKHVNSIISADEEE